MSVQVWRRRRIARWFRRVVSALVALAIAVDAATYTLRHVPFPTPHR